MKIPEKAFYVNPKNIQNKIFSLCEKESYHAAKVLRLKLGDTIVLGTPEEYCKAYTLDSTGLGN